MHLPVFVSGPHGGGKTTLIQSMLKTYPELVLNDMEFDFAQNYPSMKRLSHYEKGLIRLWFRGVCATHAVDMSRQLPGKIVMTDRSVYDSMAYAQTYAEHGLISQKEHETIQNMAEKMGAAGITVILQPSIDVVLRRLQSRTTNAERTARDKTFSDEDSTEFVTTLCKAFDQWKNVKTVYYISNNEAEDIPSIMQWIRSF